MTITLNRPETSAMKAPQAAAPRGKTMNKKELAPSRVAALTQFSRGLEHLANNAPNHLSTPQLTFFLFAALGHLEKRHLTYSEIKMLLGTLGPAIGSTYGVFMGPSKRFVKGVNWLRQEVDPNDQRRRLLHLTEEGLDIVQQLAIAIEG